MHTNVFTHKHTELPASSPIIAAADSRGSPPGICNCTKEERYYKSKIKIVQTVVVACCQLAFAPWTARIKKIYLMLFICLILSFLKMLTRTAMTIKGVGEGRIKKEKGGYESKMG